MLTVNLMQNKSPVEKIGKNITVGTSASCALKDGTSVLRPVLRIQTNDNVYDYNYLRITEFNRYYFIDDIISLNNNIWEVKAHVDVLETYKNAILANTAVIKRQQNQYNLYLDDPDFHVYNYEKLQTLQFPANTFNKVLKYVLVVNGGQ